MAGEVASTFVSIVPSARGFGSQLDKQIGGGVKSTGAKMGKLLGAAMVGAAVGGAALIVKFTKDAAVLDTKMREVVTLFGETGVAAEKSLGIIQRDVKALSNEFGIAQEVLTGGLYQAISAGVPRENAFTFMQVASKASIAGVTDVETAVDGITTTINAFGLEASQAEAISDSMFAAVKGGKTNFEELSASLFNVAPAAAAAGVSFQEVNAAIATLTAGGTPTSVATTQIRAALTGLQKPSKELNAIFGALGYENAQMAVESKGLAFALDAVKKASKGNNGELQKLLGSSEAVAAANVLAGTGAEKFTAELKAQKNAAGATDDAFGVVNDGVERQMAILKTNLTNVGLSIGQALLPHLNTLLAFINDTVLPGFDKFAPVLAAVGDVIKNELVPAFRDAMPVLKPIATFLLTIIGGAIVGVVKGAVQAIKGLLDVISGVFNLVKAVMTGDWSAAWDAVKQILGGALDFVVGAIKVWFNLGILGIFKQFGKILLKSWKGLWTGITKLATSAFNGVKGLFTRALSGLRGLVVGAVKGYLRMWLTLFKGLLNLAVNGWKVLRSAFGGALAAIRSVVAQALAGIRGAFASAWNAIKSAAVAAFRALRSAVANSISAVLGLVRSLPGRVKSALGNLGSLLLNAGRELISGLIRGILSKLGDVGSAMGSIGKKVAGFLPGSPVKEGPLRSWNRGGAGKRLMNLLVLGIRKGSGAVTKQMNRISKAIEQAVANKQITKAAGKEMSRTVDAIGKQIARLEKRYSRMTSRLSSMQKARAQMTASVADSIRGELDLGSVVSEPNQFGFGGGRVTFEAVASRVRTLAARAGVFGTRIKQMLKAGIPRGLVQEVQGLGIEEGIAVADALLSGSKTQVRALQQDWSALNHNAKRAGSILAGGFFDAGIKAQQGMIRGLLRVKPLRTAAQVLARILTKEMRRALGIKSPSVKMEREVGLDAGAGVGEGVVKGIASYADAATQATVDLVTAPRVSRFGTPGAAGGADGSLIDYDRLADALAARPLRVEQKVNGRQAGVLYIEGKRSAEVLA